MLDKYECLIISKNEEGLLVACNAGGIVELKRVKYPKEEDEEQMKIEIRQMEIVKEGTLIYALVPKIPLYDPKQEEREKEIELLHLGEAELTQKEGK